MKFGLFMAVWENPDVEFNHKRLLQHVVDYVTEADRLGLSSVFFTEHHFTGLAQIPCALDVISFLAAKTKQIRLGTGVTILPWHNPVLLAEQVATLDLLSDGRFDFGVGRGFRFAECKGFNIPGDNLQDRYDESMKILKKCWTEPGRFTHHGPYWNYDDVVIDPKSVQVPHVPVWVSADSENSVRRTAEEGHNLMLAHFATAKDMGARVRLYRECIERSGRVYDPHSALVVRAFCLADTPEEAAAARQRHRNVHANNRKLSVDPDAANDPATAAKYRSPTGHSDDALLIGTVEEVKAKLRLLQEEGIEYVLLMDVSGNRQVLRRFSEEIAPVFADGAHAVQPARVAATV